MLKKIMFSLLALIMLYSSAAAIYRIFEPQDDTDMNAGTYLDYDSLKEYLLSTGEGTIHYLFFSSIDSADCQYVVNTVMSTVQNDTKLQIAKIIETVDITALEKALNTDRLQADWNISAYPAFAAVRIENGAIVVDNTLQYESDKPMNAASVEEWLKINGLIN